MPRTNGFFCTLFAWWTTKDMSFDTSDNHSFRNQLEYRIRDARRPGTNGRRGWRRHTLAARRCANKTQEPSRSKAANRPMEAVTDRHRYLRISRPWRSMRSSCHCPTRRGGPCVTSSWRVDSFDRSSNWSRPLIRWRWSSAKAYRFSASLSFMRS